MKKFLIGSLMVVVGITAFGRVLEEGIIIEILEDTTNNVNIIEQMKKESLE